MIRVHSAVYRLLWIVVAVIGTLLLTVPLMLFSDGVHPHDPEAFRIQAIFSGLAGAAILTYSVWRLIMPLKAPPQK